MWRELDHDSIAEFYGVVYDSNYSPALISPWYDKGSADIYLQSHPDAEPMKLVCDLFESTFQPEALIFDASCGKFCWVLSTSTKTTWFTVISRE